ncbi:hypothetical protein, partial [Mycobacterium sp.]|uniref:hypothetical protein n=1 Tax=Mycobacterium sp. TaxID=1785 RepID=UPI0025ED8838
MLAEPPELPSLPEVESASFQHYLDSADYFRRAADWLGRTFTAARDAAQHPGGTEWTGQAQRADLDARQRDLQRVSVGAVDPLRAGEKVCVAAFEQMTASRHTVLDAVREVREAGFSVGPHYTVSYTGTVANDAEYVKRLAEAQQHRTFIRHRVAAMVEHDRDNAQKMDEALSGLETFTFDEPKAIPDDRVVGDNDRKQAHPVDRTWKRDPAPPPNPNNPSTGEVPDPVGKLGLPNYNPGSLSDEEARVVYAQGELRMRQLNDTLASQGVSAEERAKIMFAQRNGLRAWARDLMSNRGLADQLNKNEPNLTWDQIVARHQARGLTGDDLYKAIIEGSTRSRASVNESLDINPDHPPPLPPVRPGTGPGSAPIISQPPNLPPTLNHPPVVVPPTDTNHPPVAIPPTVLDHPPLPPWLQNPSPPGFDVHP